MKFLVSYLFSDAEDEGLQVDIISAQDENSCRNICLNKGYIIVSIDEYNEDTNDNELTDESQSDFNTDLDYLNINGKYEDNSSDIFPNAGTKEDLEEEYEQIFSKFSDN